MSHPSYHCPNCHQRLPGTRGSAIICSQCHETYAIHNGFPELIAKKFLDDFKAAEQHFHDELSAAAPRSGMARRNAVFHLHFKQPMLALPVGSTILEVAGGSRADGIELALNNKFVTTLDIASEAVAQAQDLAERAGVGERMRFCVADGEHLPFADSSFDATFVAASFHHFPNQLPALKEMKRVTKPGGYVIWGVEPAAWPYRTIFRLLAPLKRLIRQRRKRRFNSIADDTTTGYSEQHIRQLFAAADLSLLEIKPVKLLTEFYDSTVWLLGKLTQRSWQPVPTVDHVLSTVDAWLEHVPGLKKLFWHWNVLSRVP